MDTILKCSNCGAPLELEGEQRGVICCPFCGTRNLIEALLSAKGNEESNDDEEEEYEEYYYPIAFSLSAFEQKCTHILAEEDLVPDDIFNEIDFKNGVKCVYLPFWEFCGKYTLYYQQHEDSNTTTGTAQNGFRYFGLACDTAELSPNIKEKLSVLPFEIRVKPEVDCMNVITKNGEIALIEDNLYASVAENDFIKNLRKIIESKESQGKISFKSTSWNVQISNDPDDVVYIPIYIAEFTYKQHSYYILSDAFSGESMLYDLPKDSNRKAELDKTEFGLSMVIAFIVMFLPAILWIFGPLGFWKALLWSFLSFFVGGLIITYGSSKEDAKKKEIKDRSRANRRKDLPK